MIISIGAEKAFDNIQYPLMIKKKKKALQKADRNISQHDKSNI